MFILQPLAFFQGFNLEFKHQFHNLYIYRDGQVIKHTFMGLAVKGLMVDLGDSSWSVPDNKVPGHDGDDKTVKRLTEWHFPKSVWSEASMMKEERDHTLQSGLWCSTICTWSFQGVLHKERNSEVTWIAHLQSRIHENFILQTLFQSNKMYQVLSVRNVSFCPFLSKL
jgi:hypothetical protein